MQMGACGRLDSSDGFKSRIEDCQKSFDRAEAQHDIGNWAEAALAFTNVVDECKALIEKGKARDTAKSAAEILAEAIKAAQSAGAKEYAPVRFSSATDLAKRGRGEFDAFKFADAAATYATAKSQFDLAAHEAGQAKQEEARKKREAEEAAQRAEAERREREAREAAERERKRAEEIERHRHRLYPEFYNSTSNGVVTDTVDLQSKYDKKLNSSSRACDVDDAGHKGVQLWEGGPYWAETNIGAKKPEDYGYYFWWGDNVGYKRVGDAWVASDGFKPGFAFDKNNTPTYGKSADFLMKEGWITTGGFLAPEHDAAHVHWGGNWRMPTYEELRGLTENCDWNWTSVNGVNGYKVQGKGVYASVTIFLPCAGGGGGTTLFYPGSLSNYWSSVPDLDDGAQRAWGLFLARSTGSDSRSMSHINRGDGYSVRPVQGLIKQRAK